MSEKQSPATDLAMDLMKQLVTLNSAVLVLSGTLLGHVLPVPAWDFGFLGVGWLCLVVSLACSIDTMSRIVSSVDSADGLWTEPPCRTIGNLAKWLFFFGVTMLVIFAGVGIFPKLSQDTPQRIEVELVRTDSGSVEVVGIPPIEIESELNREGADIGAQD